MRTTNDFLLPDPPPWEGTRAHLETGLSPPPPGLPPCSDCLAACCWFVLLENGRLETQHDLDWIEHHLDYDRLVVWLDPGGGFTLGAISPCRHLDRRDCTCTVHSRSRQPQICQRFDATVCWYRRQLRSDREWLYRVDGKRWPSFRERVLFDDDGDILSFRDRRLLDSRDRRYEVPVTLAFELFDDMAPSPDLRGDLLVFLAGFDHCRVARTPRCWYLLVDTARDAEVPAREIEAEADRIGEFGWSECFFPTCDAVFCAVDQLGADVFDMPHNELRAWCSEAGR